MSDLADLIEVPDFIKIDLFIDVFRNMLNPFDDIVIDLKLDLSPYPPVIIDTNELK